MRARCTTVSAISMLGSAGLVMALALGALLTACRSQTAPHDGGPGPDTTTTRVSVDVSIQPDQDRVPISAYIYGSNQDYAGNVWTVRRLGGNRLTGYNWENNYSNAGSDWEHSSDTYLLWSAGLPDNAPPAAVVTRFHDQSLAMGAASIVTLQMGGYVSADANGTVQVAETAPSPRWMQVAPKKPGAFRTTPDLTDGVVYMDELVNLLVSRYGPAGGPLGVRWYSLDNEPCLWANTHPRIHPQKVGARELIDRSVALASAVKNVDPQAGIMGPAAYGMNAYVSLQDSPDWPQLRGSYRWFLDFYLDEMRKAEATSGRRLLDALDVHWYPEARGDNRITDTNATTTRDEDARLQAPRTLWDSSYLESSWIAQYLASYLPILPALNASIAQHYPGTRLAITEYAYGGGSSITGGLAQADVLGVFGRSGVYIATLWGISSSDTYVSTAFKLFRDYDGHGATYGNTAVRATAADNAKVSVFAAIEGDDPSRLHIIAINKTRAPLELRMAIGGSRTYSTADVWGFDKAPRVDKWAGVTSIPGNQLRYPMPALSAAHFILR